MNYPTSEQFLEAKLTPDQMRTLRDRVSILIAISDSPCIHGKCDEDNKCALHGVDFAISEIMLDYDI